MIFEKPINDQITMRDSFLWENNGWHKIKMNTHKKNPDKPMAVWWAYFERVPSKMNGK
jgi:hypothetical protein